jgi:hypothetical protein
MNGRFRVYLLPLACILFLFPSSLDAQTSSPKRYRSIWDAAKVEKINVHKIKWESSQEPHFDIPGFNPDFLEKDFFALNNAEMRLAEILLLQKINAYRKVFDKPSLRRHQIGSEVAAEFAEELAQAGRLDHHLHGKSPTDRIRKRYPKNIWVGAAENLNRIGGTTRFQSVDDYTDEVLACWINSMGHNGVLLSPGDFGCVGFFTKFKQDGKWNMSYAVFNLLRFPNYKKSYDQLKK